MTSKTRTKLASVGVIAGLAAASALLTATPAHAAEGDASAAATVASYDILGVVGDSVTVGAATVVGSGEDEFIGENVPIFGDETFGLNANIIANVAVSNPYLSGAVANVLDIDFQVLGEPILELGSAIAEADCTVGAPGSTEVILGDLVVFGEEQDEESVASNGLETDTTLLDGTAVELTLEQVENSTGTSADAVALRATITATFADLTIATAQFDLATASCETPPVLPVTATSISPSSGSTVGGEKVTITGTGFNAATQVVIGDVPAIVDSYSDDGLSLIVTTPAASTPGTVDVVVANPGATATLAYEYVAPVVPVTPVTPVTPAATLAETGAEAPIGVLAAMVVLLLGLGAFGIAAARRRSTNG